MKAAERASARLDDLKKLFGRFEAYIKRLSIRVRAAWGHEAEALAIRALVEMLKAFMLATKFVKEGRFSKPRDSTAFVWCVY